MNPEPARLRRRTPAFLFDQFVVVLLVVPAVLAAGVSVEGVVSPGRTRRFVVLALMAVAFVYHFSLELRSGQTVGKRLLGLRTVQADGGSLTVRGSVLRNALRLVDGLGYWTVAVAVLYRESRQSASGSYGNRRFP